MRSLSVGRRGSNVNKSSKETCCWYTMGVSDRDVNIEELVSVADRVGEVGREANSGCAENAEMLEESGGDRNVRLEKEETRLKRSGVDWDAASSSPRVIVEADEDLANTIEDRAEDIRGGPLGRMAMGIRLNETRLAALAFLL